MPGPVCVCVGGGTRRKTFPLKLIIDVPTGNLLCRFETMGHTPASRQKNSIQSQSDDVWEEEKYDNVSNSEQGELVAGIDDGLYDNENKNNTCPDCKEVADDQDRPL